MDIKISKHMETRMKERNLEKQWIFDTIKYPNKIIVKSDKEIHFLKKIYNFANRCLRNRIFNDKYIKLVLILKNICLYHKFKSFFYTKLK